MKKLLDFANSYVSELHLEDLTLIKLCTTSCGILLGLFLGKKHTKPATIASIGIILLSLLHLIPALYKKGYQVLQQEKPEEEGFIMRIVTEEEAS